MAALLDDDSSKLSENELDRLTQLIDLARERDEQAVGETDR